jgi:hypothetical protein
VPDHARHARLDQAVAHKRVQVPANGGGSELEAPGDHSRGGRALLEEGAGDPVARAVVDARGRPAALHVSSHVFHNAIVT